MAFLFVDNWMVGTRRKGFNKTQCSSAPAKSYEMKKTLTEIFALLVGCQVFSSSILEVLWLLVSESTAAALLSDFQTQHYSTLKRGHRR